MTEDSDDNANFYDQQFLTALIGSIPVFWFFLVVFNTCRQHRKKFYATNFEYSDRGNKRKHVRTRTPPIRSHHALPMNLEDPSTHSFLSLLYYLWDLTDDEICRHTGVDGLAYIKMCWMFVEVSCICFPFCIFILVPLYATGDNPNTLLKNELMPQFTVANIRSGDWRLWMIIVACWITMAIVFNRVQKCYEVVSRKADQWHTRKAPGAYAVMIRDVPVQYRDKHALRKFMQDLFGDDVSHVKFAHKVDEMLPIWNEYKLYLDKKEALERPGKTHIGVCCWREDMSKVKRHIQFLESKMELKYKEFDKLESVAFVFFNTLKSTVICSSVVLLPHERDTNVIWNVQQAPDTEDIVWNNLSVTKRHRNTSWCFVVTAYTLLILYFTPLMIGIQALVNLDVLARQWKAFGQFLAMSKTFRAVLTGLVPVIIYQLFFILLPYFLYWICGLRKYSRKSDRDVSALSKHMDCLVAMGLLVTFISSGVLQEVESMNDPDTWSDTLGSNLPRNSTFFIIVMCWGGMIGLGWEISGCNLLIKNVFGLVLHPQFLFYVYTPGMLFYFAIMVTYIPIAPLILIPSIMFFTSSYFIYLYQLLYVYRVPYEIGARNFPKIHGYMFVGIYVSQAVLLGFFSLEKGYVEFPVMLVTLLYCVYAANKQKRAFIPYFENASLRTAEETDKDRKPTPWEDFPRHAYEPDCVRHVETNGQSTKFLRSYIVSDSIRGVMDLFPDAEEELLANSSGSNYDSMVGDVF